MLSEFKHGQAYQHLEKGQHLESLGRMDEAMVEFKRAVEADPSMASAHTALGHHYQRKGLLTKAADEFRSAALLGGDSEAYFNLGRALSDLERYPEAADAFRNCLALDAEDPGARYELSFVDCAQGRYREGLVGFEALAQQFPDDWELELAQANCHIGLQEFAAAEQHLRQALLQAPPSADVSGIREALSASMRHLEFSPRQVLSLKDHFYAEYGMVVLGTAQDDGLNVPLYQSKTIAHRDIGVTLYRLLALMREYDWQLTALVAVDSDSQPIAIALSQLLNVAVRSVDELGADDFALVIMANCSQPELCEVALEHMPGHHISFAFSLRTEPEPVVLTDLVGIACSGTCKLPWQRPRRRPPEVAASCILRAFTAVAEEDNLAQQTEYYALRHRLLRFFDLSSELRTSGPMASPDGLGGPSAPHA